MKRRKNKSTGIYAYLNSLGLLENGSESELAIARKEYWKKYQAEWIKAKRKQANITIYMTDKEIRVIGTAAKINKRSKTKYIKDAALAYAWNIYLVPDTRFYMELVGNMTSIIALLKSLLSQGYTDFKETRKLFDEFLAYENRLKVLLYEPVLADTEWFKELAKDEAKREYLINLLKAT